ncbi:hypothetical protein PPL_01679 [Heterostelium album PN500]|uniref:Uncharacterized protein n=1 Tax=Heterostelium pallidum (strain ATCC 26659 / Pp 5 / PN500) TaxID=670386 RepID=D3B063_HETP5|nr:hypothetical protein PPL_01679 [Heterostelium album PN500]EFA84687.1 hypothetical protein PPL_01679 [Heterostelium album PN500]|eukprot:XP_020436800.1 hypothetical protein PPL_01679 [Heterostelium album PN500]
MNSEDTNNTTTLPSSSSSPSSPGVDSKPLTPPQKIDVIALDLGGVIFSAGKEVASQSWERRGYDSKLIRQLLTSPESMDLRKGLLTDDQFWNGFFKQRCPANYDVDVIKKLWYEGYVMDHDILALLYSLRTNGYRIAAFSGNIESRIDYLEDKYNFRRHFDYEVYSYDCHYTKPDTRFIEVLIKTIYPNATPDTYQQYGSRIVYIDDNVKDAEPSKLYNIPTFIYHRGQIDQLKSQLSELDVIKTKVNYKL